MSDKVLRRPRESGQILILTALMLPVLIACAAMALDAGYAYDYKKQMQAAADSGAHAAALFLYYKPTATQGELETAARHDTSSNGFTHGTASVTVTVTRSPAAMAPCNIYDYSAQSTAVRVQIDQPKPTFLGGVAGFSSFTIGACAVANRVPGGNASFVILSPDANGALTISGGSNITIDGTIQVNSSSTDAAKVGGGGTTYAAGINVHGGYDESGGSQFCVTPGCNDPTTGAPVVSDPLAYLPEPTPSGTVRADPNCSPTCAGGSQTLQPGIYTGGITISGGTVTLAPGNYYLNGGKLDFKGGAQVTGTDVFIYGYNNALFSIANNTTVVTLSAPTTGTYRGILYFQQRSDVKDAVVSGGATVNLNGVIYISNPSSKFTFSGGSSSGTGTLYTSFVVNEFIIGGGGTFHSDWSTAGGSPLMGPPKLVE
ncbi:MAG TPA: pilus assembly protein TadG-related protein [Vicinamibacterales bacterium]|nr:pilus assembly protein TadG-related protein [Vicinamibacterales bacterium]